MDDEINLDDLENVSGGLSLSPNSRSRTFELTDPQKTGYMDQLENIIMEFKNFSILKPEQEEDLRRKLREKLTSGMGRPNLRINITKRDKDIDITAS